MNSICQPIVVLTWIGDRNLFCKYHETKVQVQKPNNTLLCFLCELAYPCSLPFRRSPSIHTSLYISSPLATADLFEAVEHLLSKGFSLFGFAFILLYLPWTETNLKLEFLSDSLVLEWISPSPSSTTLVALLVPLVWCWITSFTMQRLSL